MKILLILICLFCGINIFFHKGQKRFDWCVCSMLLLSSAITILESPRVQSHRLFILCYWASVIFHKEYRHNKFPFTLMFCVYLAMLMFIGWQDKLLTPFSRLWKPFAFMLDGYATIALAYWGTRNVRINSKWIIYTLYFVTLYGIFTLVTHIDPIQQITANTFSSEGYFEDYYFGNRIRIGSTWSHPISYGFICAIFSVLMLNYLKEKKIRILYVLLLVNVLICGSRTALAAVILMTAIYLLLRYNVSKLAKISLMLIPMLTLVYITVPPVAKKIDSVVNTAMGNSDVGGSSLDMRDEQMTAALMIFSQSPVWGLGPDYIQENMMSDKKLMDMYSNEGYSFYGFESYSYVLLIERGIIGVVLEIILASCIVLYFYKKRKKNKLRVAEGLSIFLGFAFFALSTGALDTWIFTMFFVGLCMDRVKNGDPVPYQKPKNTSLVQQSMYGITK